MTTWVDLQNDFGRFLFDGDDRIIGAVASAVKLDARSRLQIYANAYRTRLYEVLANDFPVLRTFLGDTSFEQLSDAYVRGYPSKSFTLRGFGLFGRKHQPIKTKRLKSQNLVLRLC